MIEILYKALQDKKVYNYLRYGFVDNPALTLTVTPQVGVKEVLHTSVTEWIAYKLKLKLQVCKFINSMNELTN